MADLPLWRAVEAIQDIQRLRRAQPEDVPEAIDALTQIVFDNLGEHTASMRVMVDAALTIAPDDDVQRRLDDAVAALESLQSAIGEAIRRFREDGNRSGAARYLDFVLATQFSGAAIRTQENPFELFAAPEMPLELPEHAAPDEPVAVAETDDADLRPLHGDAFHAAIAAQAEALARDPRRIYDFVATEIRFALYQGHFRAPFEVLAERTGNDADLAGLLVELLRASGIRARLVYSSMRLTHDTAAAWLDLSDFSTIETCIRDAGLTVFGAPETTVPRTLDIIEHYRVRAFLDPGDGERWIDLEPSVRAQEIVQPGRRAWTALPWNDALETEFFADPAEFGPLAFYEKRLRGALGVMNLKREARIRRRVADEAFPPPLPYAPVGFSMEQTSFAAGQEHAIRLQLVAHGAGTLLEHRFATPSHCRDRIVLRYEPATATAEALLSSVGRLAAPSFAVDLRPLLEIHHASGEISRVEGTERITAGTPLFLAIAFERPGLMSGRHATEARPLAGTEWELALEGPGMLFTAPEPDNPFVPLVEGARSPAAFVSPLLRAYHLRLGHAASRIAALTDAVGTSGPVLTMAAAALETISAGGIALRQRPSSMLIDVRNVELHFYDRDGESLAPFVELFLAEGSHHEARVLRDHLGFHSMSTVEALRAAARQSNPLLVIRQDERDAIDPLEHPDRVKNALRIALGITGRESVTVTRRPVDFGDRQISAWIARGGSAGTSDFAIGSLNGGVGNDDEPKPRKPRVIVYPEEAIGTTEHYVRFGAFAYDEEYHDILDERIEWSVAPSMPGSGVADNAEYFPDQPGLYTVTAKVTVGGVNMLEGPPGSATASDDCQATIWSAEIKKLVFEESPELTRIREGKALGRVHYAPDQKEPSPAVLPAGKRTMARMTLKVAPMSYSRPVELRIEGIGKNGEEEVLRIEGEVPLQGPFEGEVFLDVMVWNVLGIVTSIRWTFRVSWTQCHLDTGVKVFITADRPELVKTHRFWEEFFDWACDWTSTMSGDDKLAILNRLFECRTSAKVMFSYRAGDTNQHLEGVVKGGTGQCPDIAEWFLALGAVHGIEGRIMAIYLTRETKDENIRWRSMFSDQKGLNNPKFDGTVHYRLFYRLQDGEYEKDAGVASWDLEPALPLENSLWQFQHHQISLFRVNGKDYFFDASLEPGAHFEWTLGIGEKTLAPDDPFRVGYFEKSVRYLMGEFHAGGEEKWLVLVPTADIQAEKEPLKLLFNFEVA